MKIYNEVTSRFNDKTGQWETISEDSFNYKGPVMKLQRRGQTGMGGGAMAGGGLGGGIEVNPQSNLGPAPATQPTTQAVPALLKLMGYEWFEDYDVNGDGMINVVDLTSLANQGAQAAVAYGQLIVTGQVLPPPNRPIAASEPRTPSLNAPAPTRGLGGGPGGARLGGPDARVSGIGSPAQAAQTAVIAQATAGGNSTNYTLDTREFADKITDTVKVTAGYFTGLDGDLDGNDIYTMSLADSNEKYYYNVCQGHPTSASSETQLAVTFGHYAGSGSDTHGATDNQDTLQGQTEAIYKQFSSILLAENDITGGFHISNQGSTGVLNSAGTKDEYIYALVGKRNRFKDRINKKNWTITLSGSTSVSGDAGYIKLTDDSANVAATSTVAGPRYNIVSGSNGTVHTTAVARTFGFFYPEVGIMIFSGHELSASLPGVGGSGAPKSASFHESIDSGEAISGNYTSHSGFAPILQNGGGIQPNNALKFVNCLRKNGTGDAITMRSEEDQTQINYFCRVKAAQANFSNNPTFISGSSNQIRHVNMRGNPTVYVTGIGLNSDRGELVAVAKLSTPIKKNFSSEATIKVKLTY